MMFRVKIKADGVYVGSAAGGAKFGLSAGEYSAKLELKESLFGPELVLIVFGENLPDDGGREVILAKYPDLWNFPSVPSASALEVLERP